MTVAGALPNDTTRVLSAPTASAPKLADTARALLTATSISAGVLALALTAEQVQPLAAQQLSLFPADPTPGEALPPVLSRLKARYGPGRLLRARISDPDAHLWEQRVLFAEWEDA